MPKTKQERCQASLCVSSIERQNLESSRLRFLTVYAFDTLHSCIPRCRCIELRRNEAYDHMILHSNRAQDAVGM